MRNDQECLADAVAAGDARPDYAAELLRWVRLGPAASPARAWAAVGIWENASQLSRRIAMLLDEKRQIRPTGSRRWQCQAAGALLLLGAALSLLTLQPGQSPAQQGPAAAETKPALSPAVHGKLPARAPGRPVTGKQAEKPVLLPPDSPSYYLPAYFFLAKFGPTRGTSRFPRTGRRD